MAEGISSLLTMVLCGLMGLLHTTMSPAKVAVK
jgi:hypothetical protein